MQVSSAFFFFFFFFFLEVTICWSPPFSQILTVWPSPHSCPLVLTAIYFQSTVIIKYDLSLPLSFILSTFLTHFPHSFLLSKLLTYFFSSLPPQSIWQHIWQHTEANKRVPFGAEVLDYQLSSRDHLSSQL